MIGGQQFLDCYPVPGRCYCWQSIEGFGNALLFLSWEPALGGFAVSSLSQKTDDLALDRVDYRDNRDDHLEKIDFDKCLASAAEEHCKGFADH